MKLTTEEILEATNGVLINGVGSARVRGVSIDSRSMGRGEIFFALKGPRFDGHDFIADTLKNGAVGAVVDKQWGGLSNMGQLSENCTLVAVDDTVRALGDLAKFWRLRHMIPLVAVGGSCGKSTTKEMIAAILGMKRSVMKTPGNMNNQIGLPLSILSIREDHQAAVVEVGISEKGEMMRLSEICIPSVALLTNIGIAHTATLGSIEDVAVEKGKLFCGLGKDGAVIVNLDDPCIVKMASDTGRRSITYSMEHKADIYLKDWSGKNRCLNGVNARLSVFGRDVEVSINAMGHHNLSNAVAAVAATSAIGVETNDIVDGLLKFVPMPGRMELIVANGISVIDDTYNANLESTKAALNALSSMSGRKIAVLGDMHELGDYANVAHEEIGRYAYQAGIGLIIALGNFRDGLINGALCEGMDKKNIYGATDKRGAINLLRDLVEDGDVVLVKGSRSEGMENIVDWLKAAVLAAKDERQGQEVQNKEL